MSVGALTHQSRCQWRRSGACPVAGADDSPSPHSFPILGWTRLRGRLWAGDLRRQRPGRGSRRGPRTAWAGSPGLVEHAQNDAGGHVLLTTDGAATADIAEQGAHVDLNAGPASLPPRGRAWTPAYQRLASLDPRLNLDEHLNGGPEAVAGSQRFSCMSRLT